MNEELDWGDCPYCASSNMRAEKAEENQSVQHRRDMRRIAALELAGKVESISDDFHPDRDCDAPVALSEMRDALKAALSSPLLAELRAKEDGR